MCGIFGFCGNSGCFKLLRTGAFNVQHRGQKFAGIATCGEKGVIHQRVLPGLFKPNFSEATSEELSGLMGISHVSLKEPQPFLVDKSRLGSFVVCFSGNFINQGELEEKYDIFSSKSPATEILARIIRQSESFEQGIEKIANIVKGGWAIAILVPGKGIYAARDNYGFRPMTLGKSIEGCAVSSESVALNKIGMRVVRDIKPGEIVLVEKNGFQVVSELESPRKAFCVFEWIYTARISSILEGIPVKRVRMNLGAKLAENDDVVGDITAGVPMSGIGSALGYAQRSGIPYDEVLEYNRYSDRSYVPITQDERAEIAAEKLSEIEYSLRGKKIILLDDSIVRGTQIRKLIFRLKEMGVAEVHLRISAPPLLSPCRYNISTRTSEELIARTHKVDEIRKIIEAKTLKFNSIDALIDAIGLPEEDLCLACFTGEYPL